MLAHGDMPLTHDDRSDEPLYKNGNPDLPHVMDLPGFHEKFNAQLIWCLYLILMHAYALIHETGS